VTVSAGQATVPVKHTDRFFIGGQWAREVVRRVRTGTMGINGYLPDPAGP
jgi:hypothetical protein